MEDRVDRLINRLHVVCLSLLQLRKVAAYGRDSAFLGLLQGFLDHSRQLMELIRERERGT